MYEPMTYEEALAKVLMQVKENQQKESSKFEELLERFQRLSKGPNVRIVRKVEPVVPMSEEAYNNTVAFLDKLEEIVDMEIEENNYER